MMSEPEMARTLLGETFAALAADWPFWAFFAITLLSIAWCAEFALQRKPVLGACAGLASFAGIALMIVARAA